MQSENTGPGATGPRPDVQRVDAVVARAEAYLRSLQDADGHWCGELEGDTILDYSKPGGVEVTAGTVTRHRSGETVIDFSRTGARAAAPDLLTGDGAEESKAPRGA